METGKKVIKALELCANGCNDDGCVYLEEQNLQGGLAKCRCVDLLARDALALLKEQKAMVKPTKCPCGELFDAKDSSFCPKCGCAYGELSGRYTNIGR